MTSLKSDLKDLFSNLAGIVQLLTKGGDTDEIVHILPKLFLDQPVVSVAGLSGGVLKFLECTGEQARFLTTAQLDNGHGPVLDSIVESSVKVYKVDSTAPKGLKHFDDVAKSGGIDTALSVPLVCADDLCIVTAYYFGQPQEWDEADLEVISSFSKIAAWQLCSQKTLNELSAQVRQLETAIASRDIIGQAKGILMAQKHITAEQAFVLLRSKSQVLNKKLRDIAEYVSLTGELPGKEPKSITGKSK
ncbi:MAG: ANTAR domain-containing protein [Firmicutes bacterium]|nr:ANTAR domain-containing protein [Bacillota bacterium]